MYMYALTNREWIVTSAGSTSDDFQRGYTLLIDSFPPRLYHNWNLVEWRGNG